MFYFGGELMQRPLTFLAVLTLALAARAATAAPLLAVDINDRTAGDPSAADPANTAPGFEAWSIDTGTTGSATTATRTLASGYTVTFDVFDDHDPNDGGSAGDNPGAFDDRDRVVPATAPNFNQLYDDFIFVGGSAGPTGGLDLRISGGALLPNKPYRVSIYSYDGIDANMGSATPNRTAAWLDGNNADAPVLVTNFTVNIPPATDDQYKFTGVAMTDAAGQLFLKGRRTTAADVSVYVNGVEVNNIPEPGALGLAASGLVVIVARRKQKTT
jgi:hypothetical protein